MPGNYSHINRASGTILTAAIYNQDHQNHINNMTPDGVDDYSQNLTAMRAATDPGETGSESFATSLAGEIERLRFAIQDIKAYLGLQGSYWYNSPSGLVAPSLIDDHSANVTQMRAITNPGSGGSESLATDLRGELERIRFTIKSIKDTFGVPVTYWYDPPAVAGTGNTSMVVRHLNGSCSGSNVPLTASEAVLRTTLGASVWRTNLSGTCNIATAGPVANGRDQAAAFADNSFVYIYWIWNGTTIATLASATGPVPGPTLPSGYTHYALATIVRHTTGNTLRPAQIRGAYVGFSEAPLILDVSTTTGNARTALSWPNANWIGAHHVELAWVLNPGSGNGSWGGFLGIALTNGTSDQYLRAACNASGYGGFVFPNQAQVAGLLPARDTYYYFSDKATGAGANTAQIRWCGYTVCNGE